ncbi:hypothetical protein [Microvirga sesbaniae]|uniref:hypothetical protein n=1 Tax=Microvirga sesbaniae TaxID=681392 RepID=UPI0021C63B89|nr:hypothetical protein [Microvirga sp. HBU67692]
MPTEDKIDLARLPPVLPVTVARTTPDGLPTKEQLDWDQFARNWYKTTVVNLNTRLTEVRSDTDGNSDSIVEETNARTSADEALAEQITTVQASVGTFTAGGQVYFGARATPSGAEAAYGIYLTAGNAFTGFEMIAKSDGTSAIGLSANQLYFTDSGTGTNVFSYGFDTDLGQNIFTFNVPVRIGTEEIFPNSVTKPQDSTINASNLIGDTGGNWVTFISHTAQTDGGAYSALIIADFMYRVGSSGGTTSANWRLIRERDGNIRTLRSGALSVFVDYTPVLTARLITDVRDNDIFRLQARIAATAGFTFQFDDKSILLDLRKR